MTAAKLIAALSKLPPDAPVRFYDENYDTYFSVGVDIAAYAELDDEGYLIENPGEFLVEKGNYHGITPGTVILTPGYSADDNGDNDDDELA